MLHIRDISLRHRLLITNFTMVFVPIAILTALGFLLISGLRFSSSHNDLTTLWPEKGPALSIQYTVSSLRVKAERPGPLKVKDMREDCRVLEDLGIATAIVRNDQVAYITPGIDFYGLADRVLKKAHGQQTVMTWDGDGFFFRYTSPHSGTTVIAAGNTPFIAKSGIREGMAKGVMQMLLLFIVGTASAIIIACGFILSRVLSRQILTPLAALRTAAAEIEKGNLDYELRLSSRDELGRTCEAFDHMRRQLRSARLAQEKYEQNRKELIAGISHDLSTPLTLLKGYASGILVGIAKTAEKRHHYVELIYQNACTLEKLVDRLFLFSKLDLGQVSFMMERVSLRDYFADFAAENTERLAERGLILLDIMLPGTDGFHICRRIREEKEVPILMVSAKREDMDKIRGLGLGADDYIIKPFSPTELVARVKAHITRYERLMGKAQQKAADGEVIRSGDLEIYVDKHRVYVKGEEIALTNREFELLVFLAKHPGLVFSRDRLFERVWGLDAEGDTATVMVHINRIREKIEPDPAKPIYIETVWGAGYRFKE